MTNESDPLIRIDILNKKVYRFQENDLMEWSFQSLISTYICLNFFFVISDTFGFSNLLQNTFSLQCDATIRMVVLLISLVSFILFTGIVTFAVIKIATSDSEYSKSIVIRYGSYTNCILIIKMFISFFFISNVTNKNDIGNIIFMIVQILTITLIGVHFVLFSFPCFTTHV